MRKPIAEQLPSDLGISKISKRTFKKDKIISNKDDLTMEEVIDKYFSKDNMLVKLDKKGKEKAEAKIRNYKAMENRVMPGGSQFDDMIPSSGVTIKENGKNKMGKHHKDNVSKSMTRQEYLMSSSRNMMDNRTIDFNLPGLKDVTMDETLEMHSTIKSNTQDRLKRTSKRSHILPPIEKSNIGNYTARNVSYSNLLNHDKIIMDESKTNMIKNSLIIKTKKQDKMNKLSKSTSNLLTQMPLKKDIEYIDSITRPKVDSGFGRNSKVLSSFADGRVLTDTKEVHKQFDEFNRQLLYNTEIPGNASKSDGRSIIGKKPKVNRPKVFIEKQNLIMLNQEHRDNKKAFIDRILEFKEFRKQGRYSML